MTSRRSKAHGFKLALCGCLCLFLFTLACTQQPPPDTRAADETTIRALDAQWSKTAAAKDLDGSVAYYADDASLLPPNAPIAADKQAIRAVWSSLLSSGASLSWEASKVEVSRSGDLAYIVGAYTLATKDPEGKPVNDHGKFVEVWKKQADGKWKVEADIFNSDLPPAPEESPEKKS